MIYFFNSFYFSFYTYRIYEIFKQFLYLKGIKSIFFECPKLLSVNKNYIPAKY